MDLRELLDQKASVEKELKKELAAEVSLARKLNPHLIPFIEAVEEFSMRGGKRFRALLLLAGFRIGGGKNLNVALPAAAALETFQSWMLAHDDVIDHGERRRGGPTLHVAMAEFHDDNDLEGPDTDFGEGMAITLGDFMESVTVRTLLGCKVPEKRKVELLEEYSRMTRLTALGQMLDIRLGASQVDRVRESDVLLVHRLKSAVYTVSAPLRMGAILAGAGKGTLETLGKFGDDIGIAFQLRDDILGVGLSSEDVVGKSTNDLFEGKRTLLVVKAWQHGSPQEKRAIERALGNRLGTQKDLDAAIDVITDTGSLRYSEEMIASLRNRAFRSVKGFAKDDASLLRDIGTMLTERKL